MELKILKETQSPLFARKEIEATITAEAVPSYSEVTQALSKKYSASENSVRVKKVEGKFGSQDFKVDAFIYKSKEDLDKTEVKTKQELEAIKKAEEERKKAEEEAKKAEEEAKAAAEAPKEEAPAEETKSEEESKTE